MHPANPIVRDQQIAGAALIWGHPELTTFIQGNHFERCDITITCSARGIIISDSVFHDCTISVKRPFSNCQFFQVGFDGCRFVGRFPGCEFGFRDFVPRRAMRGYVRNCDFTQATLDPVALNGADLRTLRLPPWPHFLVTSQAAFAAVAEFADDPEWAAHARLIWPQEMTALAMLYRTGGRRGFSMPADEALAVLQRYPTFTTVTTAP